MYKLLYVMIFNTPLMRGRSDRGTQATYDMTGTAGQW